VQANQRVYHLAAVGRLLLTDCCGRDARFTVVETPRKGDPGQPIARNRGNVGWNLLSRRGTSRRLDVPIWVHEKLGAVELDQRATGQTLGADLMVDGGLVLRRVSVAPHGMMTS
jgi:hypothetical protein